MNENEFHPAEQKGMLAPSPHKEKEATNKNSWSVDYAGREIGIMCFHDSSSESIPSAA